MIPRILLPLFGALLVFASDSRAQSVVNLGGGCPGNRTMLISGPLTVGTFLQIDELGCTGGKSGIQHLFLGQTLPAPITFAFPDLFGTALCDLVVNPQLVASLFFQIPPIRIPIPQDPLLVGAQISMQAFCDECGFAGCFLKFGQGARITIG